MFNLICVICGGKRDKIHLFTEESLEKCLSILQIRANNGLKGGDLAFPRAINDNQGYHTKCLCTFKALPKRYKPVVVANSSETAQLPGPSASTNTSQDFYIIEGENTTDDESQVPIDKTMEEPGDGFQNSPSNDDLAPKEACVFCQLERKKYQGRWECLKTFEKEEAINAIKTNALECSNIELMNRIRSLQDLKKKVRYHQICKVTNRNKYRRLAQETKPKTTWHQSREIVSLAFEKVVRFVSDFVVNKNQMFSLQFITKLYIEYLRDVAQGEENMLSETPSRHFEDRLLAKFNKKIVIVRQNGKKFLKPYTGVAMHDNDFAAIDKREVLALAAIYMREDILSMKTEKLPEYLTVSDLIKGESRIPETVEFFYRTLLSGESYRRQKSVFCQRMVNSLSNDSIYLVSNGKIKTTKHITLGLAVKGLTNSKKIVNILNKYGHCCSYSVLEELETEATFSTTDQSEMCPEDILRSSNLCTGVAFDNFDRFVDTNTGKDTLHDTVGIIFQNVITGTTHSTANTDSVNITSKIVEIDVDSSELSTSQSRFSTSDQGSRKRRRKYDAVFADLEPYLKKPKAIKCLLSLDSPLRLNTFIHLTEVRGVDFAWMLSHALQIPGTPMWVGFNSLIHDDDSSQQRISYLTTINKSPTETSVVQETMSRSLRVAEECGDLYVQVTYDLAIAKVAFQIQITEKPRFDRVFIHLGTFHVMMAYFKAVGKFIDHSGLTNMMVDSGLLAAGSVNSFINGKHFNRCKRLHPLICLALEILHFQSFLNEQNLDVSGEVRAYLKEFQNHRADNPKIENESLIQLFDQYEEFKKNTLQGHRGKTAQFFIIYTNLIHWYLMLNRSVRTSNLEMFQYVLPKIVNLFFVFNQQNYSRYLVLYHDNLLQVDRTHPGLREELKMGSFGIKRTGKPFSRQPIDLTLEQTINADAGNKLTGIVHSTNSVSARQRWCKSHSMRAQIISHVVEECGLKNCQDVTADLQKSRVKRNALQLDQFLSIISRNIDPFSLHLKKDALFNISSGREATKESSNFLLNIEEHGNSLREKFVSECVEDEKRFEKPIKQNKIFTFLNTEKKQVKFAGKVTEVKLQRDLFGKLLGIALEKSVNLEKVLSYPLTPVPLSFCHIDGGMCKTNKSALLRKLETEVDSSMPSRIDVAIIDGFFVLHTIKNLPATFRNVSKQILQTVLQTRASTVIVSFDRYFSHSIKDTERSLRGTTRGRQYQILGPDQERPADFTTELQNINFKEALVNFLINDWACDEMTSLIGTKTVYVNHVSCFSYQNLNGTVVKSEVTDLSCPLHEESDTKIVFHACKIEADSNVVIRCSDTDILIIMLGNMQHVDENVRIWMQVGVKNNERFINVTEMYKKMGRGVCDALPAFHALTGCDYNPAFYRKGKVKPFQILRSNREYTTAFSDISKYPDCHFDSVILTIESFICQLYGLKKTNKVNEARVEIFLKVYKCKKKETRLNLNVGNFDGSSLPPCKTELEQHILRSAYIGKLWSNAHAKKMTDLRPTECGWQIEKENLDFRWFHGDQLPNTVDEIILETEQDKETEATSQFEHLTSTIADEDFDSDSDGDSEEDNNSDDLALY